MNSGLYTITSPSGRFYLGSTISFKKRWTGHKWMLRKNEHHSWILQAAWNKYGEENMIFAVYLLCEPHECLDLEQIALDTLRPAYNIALSARSPTQGRKLSTEHIEKIRAANTGRKMPPRKEADRKARSIAQQGREVSAATREKKSIGAKIKRSFDVEKQALWEARELKRGSGRPHTDAGRSKIAVQASARVGEKSNRSIPVYCVEMDKQFASSKIAMAWLRENGVYTERTGAIGDACRGQRETAHGFHWKFVLKEPKVKVKKGHKNRPPISKETSQRMRLARLGRYIGADNNSARAVKCIETDTIFLTMKSAIEWIVASGKIKATRSGICACCAGRTKSAFGFHWEYVDPDKP